jgi:hypothetical protein
MFSFNTRKPQQYSHTPIYWNLQKEDMNERKRRIEAEETSDAPEAYRSRIKGQFVRTSIHLNRKKPHYSGFFRKGITLSIVTALIAIAYFLLR